MDAVDEGFDLSVSKDNMTENAVQVIKTAGIHRLYILELLQNSVSHSLGSPRFNIAQCGVTGAFKATL